MKNSQVQGKSRLNWAALLKNSPASKSALGSIGAAAAGAASAGVASGLGSGVLAGGVLGAGGLAGAAIGAVVAGPPGAIIGAGIGGFLGDRLQWAARAEKLELALDEHLDRRVLRRRGELPLDRRQIAPQPRDALPRVGQLLALAAQLAVEQRGLAADLEERLLQVRDRRPPEGLQVVDALQIAGRGRGGHRSQSPAPSPRRRPSWDKRPQFFDSLF